MLTVSKEEFVLSFLIKEYEAGKHIGLALKARALSIKWHGNRKRDDGTPYFCHPNEVVYIMILIGITDEITLATGFLHDVIEEEDKMRNEIARETNKEVAYLVKCMSKTKNMSPKELRKHFQKMKKDIRLIIAKTIDRYVNMRRSMFGIFNKPRMEKYIFETETFILPISEKIINEGRYSEYENSLRLLRSFIKGILEAAKPYVELMEMEEENKKLQVKNAKRRCKSRFLRKENKRLLAESADLKRRLDRFMDENKKLKIKFDLV